MPAAVVIDKTATVRFADVSPDWLVRTEPDAIIEAVYATVHRAATQTLKEKAHRVPRPSRP